MSGVLAILPARAGSRGIPGKNLARIAGRSLLDWSVACARDARCVERVVVTTDCRSIAEAARSAGAEAPFLRPARLARDDTPGIEPLLHAIRWLDEQEGYAPEWIVQLQPTSPLRTAEDVDTALELVRDGGGDAVVSVTPAKAHPFWSRSIDPEGRLHPFLSADLSARRQELPPAYVLNGAIYASRRATLLARESFEGPETRAYVMPPERSVDVDEPFDLELADWLLRRRAARPVAGAGRGARAVADPVDHPALVTERQPGG